MHAGPMADGFEGVLARFPGMALPCDVGSDSARILYLGDPDELGEYPVVGIDHDDMPCMDVAAAGLDMWLADEFGVGVAGRKAANDAANKRLFGKKAGWSVDAPGRLPKSVAGPAPGSVAHGPLPALAKPKAARKLTDKQLDKALVERASDGDLLDVEGEGAGELLIDGPTPWSATDCYATGVSTPEERAEERRRTWTGGIARSWAEAERLDDDWWLSMSPQERVRTVWSCVESMLALEERDGPAPRLQRSAGGVRPRRG